MIARLVGERELVEPVELGHQVLEVAGEAGQEVVHDLVAQEGATPIRLAPQRRAHFGLGQRPQGEHMAPAEPGAQVLAHLEVDRRHAARGEDHRALAGGGDEQGEGRLLLHRIEGLAVVETIQSQCSGTCHGAGVAASNQAVAAPCCCARSTTAWSRCDLPLPGGPHR